MLTALIVLVLAVAALVVFLFAIVIVGIWHEARYTTLSSQAPSPIAALARRMLGVYVRKSGSPDDADRQPCLSGHAAAGPADDEGR